MSSSNLEEFLSKEIVFVSGKRFSHLFEKALNKGVKGQNASSCSVQKPVKPVDLQVQAVAAGNAKKSQL